MAGKSDPQKKSKDVPAKLSATTTTSPAIAKKTEPPKRARAQGARLAKAEERPLVPRDAQTAEPPPAPV